MSDFVRLFDLFVGSDEPLMSLIIKKRFKQTKTACRYLIICPEDPSGVEIKDCETCYRYFRTGIMIHNQSELDEYVEWLEGLRG